jgi:hypothetical protein
MAPRLVQRGAYHFAINKRRLGRLLIAAYQGGISPGPETVSAGGISKNPASK